MASTDTYIAKDSAINDDIDKMRHSATAALIDRKDVVVVSSVSCIYGIGDPDEYREQMLSLRVGMIKDRDMVIDELTDIQYVRNDMDFHRGTFRVHGDVLEILPVSKFVRSSIRCASISLSFSLKYCTRSANSASIFVSACSSFSCPTT